MYKCLCFDLDNTLYSANHRLLSDINTRILLYLEKIGIINPDETQKIYSRKYLSTLQGLIKEREINANEYLEYIHDVPEESFPKRDENLIKLMQQILCKKIIITNSYKPYCIKVLKGLGIYEYFDAIFDVIDMNLLYKNNINSYKIILEKLGLKPEECLMIDDVYINLVNAKLNKMDTVIVGDGIKEHCDYSIRNIYQISDIIENKIQFRRSQ